MARDIDLLVVGRGAPERGGIPTYLDWLTRRSTSAGHATEFLNLAPATGSREDARLANLRRTATDTARLFRAARRARVVSIHSAGAPAQTLLRLGLLVRAARAAGAVAVPHVHGGRLPLWATSDRKRRLITTALAPAAAVVTVAEGGRDLLARCVSDVPVEWIPNGVDTSAFAPRTGGEEVGDATSPTEDDARRDPAVLFVGGLTERKGVLDLFAASTLLRERGVAHRLVLVGAPANEGEAARAKVLEAMPAWAELVPPRAPAEMPSAYGMGDVFCLPSWWEAMPLTVLEAMSSGLPVVATEVGDVRRLVSDGESGRIVPPRKPELLAAALEEVLRDPAAARRMGAGGRAIAEREFDADATWSRLDALFAGLSGRSPAPADPAVPGPR